MVFCVLLFLQTIPPEDDENQQTGTTHHIPSSITNAVDVDTNDSDEHQNEECILVNDEGDSILFAYLVHLHFKS